MSLDTDHQQLGLSTVSALNRLYEDIRSILFESEKQFTDKRWLLFIPFPLIITFL